MSQHTDIFQGLPKQLLILLGTIVDNNIVNNWSIYDNSNKQTCVTIRFKDSNTAIQPAYYRRVSENQARRNKDRAANHNKNKHTGTDTTSTQASLTPHQMVKVNTCTQTTGCNEDNEDSFNPKKRKVQASSPEMIRSDIKEEYQNQGCRTKKCASQRNNQRKMCLLNFRVNSHSRQKCVKFLRCF